MQIISVDLHQNHNNCIVKIGKIYYKLTRAFFFSFSLKLQREDSDCSGSVWIRLFSYMPGPLPPDQNQSANES